ncbi:hypothetical protein [Streptomyces sp. NPDC046862]|uniref:hypothetical protein n=1 Tax=Streptomyces sp. NPDC046862 TaxID=3154603 RepID=UPI0034544F11
MDHAEPQQPDTGPPQSRLAVRSWTPTSRSAWRPSVLIGSAAKKARTIAARSQCGYSPERRLLDDTDQAWFVPPPATD